MSPVSLGVFGGSNDGGVVSLDYLETNDNHSAVNIGEPSPSRTIVAVFAGSMYQGVSDNSLATFTLNDIVMTVDAIAHVASASAYMPFVVVMHGSISKGTSAVFTQTLHPLGLFTRARTWSIATFRVDSPISVVDSRVWLDHDNANPDVFSTNMLTAEKGFIVGTAKTSLNWFVPSTVNTWIGFDERYDFLNDGQYKGMHYSALRRNTTLGLSEVGLTLPNIYGYDSGAFVSYEIGNF